MFYNFAPKITKKCLIMKANAKFKPNLFRLNNYSKEKFKIDFKSGFIVAIIASLPLSIAFGIASGVSPEKGLITAIIGGFIIAVLGGSNVQISGPTGAFIIIISSIIQQFGLGGLAIATAIAGGILIIMGVLRLGTIIKFIPYPIVVGFTSGIALSIFTTQMKDLFGLTMTSIPVDFIGKWISYVKAATTINIWSLIVGVASILIIIYAPKFSKKIPGSLLAIVLVSAVIYILRTYFDINCVETIGDRFQINASLPEPSTISLSMETINLLLPSSFTIAMLCAIQSLLSATVADGVTGEKHNSNVELIAQGVGNIIVPMFGGIPVTGAIARTMTNISYGARSPIAAIVNSAVLLLILLFLGSLTRHIPMACLAGVLIIISYNMSDWRTFRSLLKNPKSDVAVLLVTFFLTVIFDLTIAIEIGLLIAMFTFMRRVTESTHISVITDELDLSSETEIHPENEVLTIPKGVEIYEIDGPFFFGIASKFDESMKQLGTEKAKVRIIRMRKVPFMDSTGLHNLESLYRMSDKENIQLVLSGVNDKIKEMMRKSGFADKVGQENICSNINEALEKANEILKTKKN